jgi:PAS domain S-box-containing protein
MRLADCQRSAIPQPPPTHARRVDPPLLVGAALLLVVALLYDPHALLPAGALLSLLAALLALATLARRPAAATVAPLAADSHRLAEELAATVARLTVSEERFRSMIEHAGAPILTFDLAENITSMNRAAELLFGWDRELLIGKAARRLLADESVRAIQRWTRTNLLTPTEPTSINVQAVHQEGRILHLEVQPTLLRTGGVLMGTEVVCRDVTARADLERLHADFLAMIGHDIRNPLGAIFGYTEMMLEGAFPLSPEHREFLVRINSNTRTVLALVGNFLDASRIEAGRMVMSRQAVDVNTVVRHTVEQYAAYAQLMDLQLDVAVSDDLPQIVGDGMQLERVASNLLTNAIKFTPRGGRVTIRTDRLPSSVAIAVSDTGIGIPAHEFSRIFQRYTQSGDGTQEGTGLGLYIVGTLVEAHGGFVTIDSTPGEGTTFTAYLPIVDWRTQTSDATAFPTRSAAPASIALH